MQKMVGLAVSVLVGMMANHINADEVKKMDDSMKKTDEGKKMEEPNVTKEWTTEKSGVYAVFETSKGRIVCELFEKESPKTVANFVGLAMGTKEWMDPKTGQKSKRPLYDGTIFHRVMPGFMIQGGDPMGTGMGGPGYKFEDEINALKHDRPGRLSMANSGPNTNGSQFFLTHVPTPWLDRGGNSNNPDGFHTVFGQTIEGQDIVTAIAAVPRDRASNRPNQNVELKKLSIVRVGAAPTKESPKPKKS